MTRAPAPAKINLALVVGPTRADGKHEVVTVLQRIDLCDRVTVEPATTLHVDGFPDDTIVRRALEALAETAGTQPTWRATIEKRVPVAAGLGGGSSDAATALRLANDTLDQPLPDDALRTHAATLGADVPFFLAPGPQLGTGDGSELAPLDLPQDYFVLVAIAHDARKASTADVYAAFANADGFEDRRTELLATLDGTTRARDLAHLPQNDLAASPLADEMRALGAFRADVSGAGPAVYGLFHHRAHAHAAAAALRPRARVWITVPAWYG
jgi:4-diphosphocytidyl-2-C-methyl-D-erythritol kinase